MNTTPVDPSDWRAALINLIAQLGLSVALTVIDAINNAKTIDDAITALRGIKTAQQYLDEAKAQLPPAPPSA